MSTEENQQLESFIRPPDLCQAEEAANDLLSAKSKKLYENAYQTFDDWRIVHNTKSASQSTLLAYFKELSEKYKPSSLWSIYSMLKTTINSKEKVDIGKYADLTAMLKRKSEGFTSKKSNILTPKQMNKFLTEAPDDIFLAVKVALIIGISGACRKVELTNIKVDDIRSEGDLLVVRIPNTKTKRPKFFTIGGEFCRIVKKYADLRPKNATTDRFFLNYRNGKCTVQVIGINTFAKIPERIATFLKLENPKSYTGHTFRRSAATLVADAGANMTTLKHLGDWKSATVADDYIEKSVKNKTKIGNIIESTVDLPSTSQEESDDLPASQVIKRRKVVGATTNYENSVNNESASADCKNDSLDYEYNMVLIKEENCSEQYLDETEREQLDIEEEKTMEEQDDESSVNDQIKTELKYLFGRLKRYLAEIPPLPQMLEVIQDHALNHFTNKHSTEYKHERT